MWRLRFTWKCWSALGRVLQHGTHGGDAPGTLLVEALSLSPLVTAESQVKQTKGTSRHSHGSRGAGDPCLSVCESDVWI